MVATWKHGQGIGIGSGGGEFPSMVIPQQHDRAPSLAPFEHPTPPLHSGIACFVGQEPCAMSFFEGVCSGGEGRLGQHWKRVYSDAESLSSIRRSGIRSFLGAGN